MMQKLFCLPKISIKDLQSKVKQRRTTHKKYNYEQEYTEKEHNHHHDIKITSPFYEKCIHKEKCECQYHRFKKLMQGSKACLPRKQDRGIEIAPRGKLQISSPEKENHLHINNHISKVQFNSPPKLLEPIQNIVAPKIELENEIMESQNTTITLGSRSIQKLPTRKTFKSIKSKPIAEMTAEEANAKIETLNHEYIKLISERLENEKFKQKYLRTLFGYIKMKSHQNKFYMYNSKAYLHNSLNMLLNHFTMDKLLDIDRLSQEDIMQIAYYMNCFPDRVKDIILDLRRAVSEMERTLAEIKQKRRTEDSGKQNDLNNYQSCVNQYEVLQQAEELLKNHSFNSQLDQLNYENMQTKESFMADIDHNNTSIISHTIDLNIANENDSSLTKNSHRENKYNLRRSSSKKMNELLLSSSPSKKSFAQNRPDHPIEQPNIRHSILASQKNQQALTRNLRSTVLGIVDQIEKESNFNRKKHTSKMKKTRLKTKYSGLQFDEKYSNVCYDKFTTKRGFQNLISDVERLDQNDMERAQVIYRQLNVEGFLDDPQKIEDLVKTFMPLFNEKSLHFFLRQIVLTRDKRYIQKLERELDDMLHVIKKNDPRSESLDFFEAKAEKKIPPHMNKMVKCHEFKVEKEETISHIKYFEAEEQIQRHKSRQQSVKLNLEQIQLRGIKFDPIDPTLTTVIKHSHFSKENNDSRLTHISDIPDQKKILQFMRRNHEGTFNYLADEIKNICRSLSKENL